MSATDLDFTTRLRTAGLRPTRQRVALARLLFDGEPRHVTAEGLHAEVRARRTGVSLATVYNTLNQFRDAGLLREVVVAPGRSYFDTIPAIIITSMSRPTASCTISRPTG
jgi:Fur family iron response transcriptional regulator